MDKNKKAGVIKVGDVSVTLAAFDIDDYVCITDMARAKGGAAGAAGIIKDWVKNPATIEFLGAWERMYNPDFKEAGFDYFKTRASLPKSLLGAEQWIEETGAIGLYVLTGRYGGAYAHEDIALEFGSALSPVFQLYVMKEYRRLKSAGADKAGPEWDAKQFLSKANYWIHADTVKKYVVPKTNQAEDPAWIAGADEVDLLDAAVFGCTARDWRMANPGLAEKSNLRDFASVNELAVLLNLEIRNEEFHQEGKSKIERFQMLQEIANYQLNVLNQAERRK